MNFSETNLAHNISHGLFHEKSYDIAEAHVDKLFYTLFTGTSLLLRDVKSTEIPVSLIFTEVADKFVAGATIEYFSNGDAPGNWSLAWTFSEDDIPSNAKKLYISDNINYPYFTTAAGNKYGMRFEDKAAITIMLTYLMEQLYKWLDENAKEGSTVSVELESVFSASVEVVDGKKVFAVEPAGEVKTLIKDDAAIEK